MMPKIRDHLYEEKTGSGATRIRFRWDRDAKRITLKGKPGEFEFEKEYARLVGMHERGEHRSQDNRGFDGSYEGLVRVYFDRMDREVDRGLLAPATRTQRFNLLNRTLPRWGRGSISTIRTEHVEQIIDDLERTPGQANNLRKALRRMFQFAKKKRFIREDPTVLVEKLSFKTTGFKAWSEEHLEQFLTAHPVGTQANLAMNLLIATGCRRSDLVRLGPRNIVEHNGVECLKFSQAKHGFAEASEVTVPITPTLYAALKATRIGNETFLVTKYGRAFTSKGFGGRMRKWCDEAGLPAQLNSHGVRKALGARLAEEGCTEYEIMAFHGHLSPQESRKYTESANRKRLARSASEKAGIGVSYAGGVIPSGKPKQ